MKSSTCIDGGRLVFCFLSLNKSLLGPFSMRCWIAESHDDKSQR